MKRLHHFLLSAAILPLWLSSTVEAANFTISSGTNTTARSLTNGEEGSVATGATLSISGSTVAVSMTGTSQLTNNGTIQQTGSGRAIDSNSGTANLTVINTGSITAVSTDAFRINTAGSSVNLTNNGTISVSAGGQAIDWAAITTGTNILTNNAGATISAVGEDAVRPGTNGVINNAGNISATPTGTTSLSGSDGIDLRVQKTGIQVTNSGLIVGRHGIATDGANAGPSSITITNQDNGIIRGLNGSGVNIDGVNSTVTANITNSAGATIEGGLTASTTSGDGDGIDIDGVLTLDNSGVIFGRGAKGTGSDGGSNNAEAIAMGGGSIINRAGGEIIGSTLSSDAPHTDTSRLGSGILVDNSSGGNAVAATQITNSGLIQGKTGFAIRLIGTFADTITNNAGGVIQGAGTVATAGAAIQTGAGNDSISNAGTITGENGKAIDMEDGDDTLHILGGVINGDIHGGSGTNSIYFNAGQGHSINYSGNITGFSNLEVQSGRFNLSGSLNNDAAVVLKGGVLNYTGSSSIGNAITVEGGEFRSNGGTFTGTLVLVSGTVSGTNLQGIDLTIGSNVVLSPGNSPGTLASASQTWEGGGEYLWEINRLAADGGTQGSNPGWDFVNITGSLDITATTFDRFTFTVDALDLLASWDASTPLSFTVASASGGITGFDASKFLIDVTGFSDQHPLDGGSFSLAQAGNTIVLTYTPIPEPSTAALLILGACAAALRSRKRR